MVDLLIVGGMVDNGRSARSLATLTLEVGNLGSMWVRAQGGGQCGGMIGRPSGL